MPTARGMLKLQLHLGQAWLQAIVNATYLCNRMHMWALKTKTPLEAWCGCEPDILHLHGFGSPVQILNEGQLTKLQPRNTKHTFVGFVDGPKAIKYYNVPLCCMRTQHRVEGSQHPTGQRVTERMSPTHMRAMTRGKENEMWMKHQVVKSARARDKNKHTIIMILEQTMKKWAWRQAWPLARWHEWPMLRGSMPHPVPNVAPDNLKSLKCKNPQTGWTGRS